MKVALSGVDLTGVDIDLGAPADVLRVRAAKALQGFVEQTDGKLALTNIVAESVDIEALRILLGDLVLAAPQGALMQGLGMSLDQSPEQLTLAATLVQMESPEVDVLVGDIRVRGRVKLAAPNLVVHGGEGSLSSSHVQITAFSLQLGDVHVVADALRGVSVKIQWGAAGFRLGATSLDASSLDVKLADVNISATAVSVVGLALDAKQIAVERASCESGSVAIQLHPAMSPDEARTDAPMDATAPTVSIRTLDRLSGQLDVDLAVDLTVPIIGHRKATHRLRVAIDGGTIDYQALEHNLAKLEDALLDFSVRENALVLERINPLFPSRGHGKPVVIWDVSGADLELARQSRVRLSVLPNARLASDGSLPPPSSDAPAKPPKASPIALRELGLLRINARIALAPPSADVAGHVQLMSASLLTLAGNIFHEPGGAREGSLLGEARDVALAVRALRLGAGHLSAVSITATGLAPIEASFHDVALDKVSVGLAGLALQSVVLTL